MNDDKLLNLDGAKVLYDDLRDRINQAGADGAVRYDVDQDLTEAQQEQARANIDAASLVQVDEEITDLWDAVDGKVTDVQVNGTSVVTDGVANVPVASSDAFGVVGINTGGGIDINSSTGKLRTSSANGSQVRLGTDAYKPIVPNNQHTAAFYGFAKAAGADMANVSGATLGVYPEAQKSAISIMLNSPVSVTGTTPTITALSGIQYVCGEVATLDITLPASGIVDVVFESGSTPTVLTITPPTGMTVEWANGFDSTSLEANTLYELNIKMVGTKCLGVAGAWS